MKHKRREHLFVLPTCLLLLLIPVSLGWAAGKPAQKLPAQPLIGEHIDYNGLSVLPMAIQRHVALLVRPRTDGRVRIASLAGFEPREFLLATDIPPYPVGDWGNYVKAAAQALEREHGPFAGSMPSSTRRSPSLRGSVPPPRW